MEYIKSKELCLLARDTLALIDKKIVTHGARTAYIFCKMLECQDKYEKFEIADLGMIALLHDIGIYKTGGVNEMIRVETKDSMPHSIYGYLFFKYLSPHPEYAKILLYHHLDYEQTLDVADPYIEFTWHLNLAEKADIYCSALGRDFDRGVLEKYTGKRYAKESFELFGDACARYDVIAKLIDGRYERELDEILDYLLLSDEEKNRYLQMLMYCIGLGSEYAVVDSATCICICDELAKLLRMSGDEREILFYSALLHDIGMLAVPKSILEAKGKLTPDQITVIRRHLQCAREILSGKVDQSIVDIVYAHHERIDGSGYPVGRKTGPLSDLQKVLQIADTVTALINERPYRPARVKDKVVKTLKDEMKAGRFDKHMLSSFLDSYDEVINEVRRRARNILKVHGRMQEQYDLVYQNFKK